ncbi:MAG: AAA family ATPase [Patescibacteria group bacterium]
MKLKPTLFFITGISGSGKTTVARKLLEVGEVAFDSKIQDGLFRFSDNAGNLPEDYKPTNREWRDKYKWTLNKTMFDKLVEENKEAKRVFLCGGADDLMQYWPAGKKVFLLKVDADTMISRLNRQDRDNNFGKGERMQDLLVDRLERFQSRQLKAGAVSINALNPADEVVKDILTQAT